MKPDIAKKWTEALRSGDYRQTYGALHSEGDGGYCCLGVLCELAVKEGIAKRTHQAITANAWRYNGEGGVLPIVVMQWAGMATPYGAVAQPGGKHRYLTSINDGSLGEKKHDFEQIAQFIEENANKL